MQVFMYLNVANAQLLHVINISTQGGFVEYGRITFLRVTQPYTSAVH